MKRKRILKLLTFIISVVICLSYVHIPVNADADWGSITLFISDDAQAAGLNTLYISRFNPKNIENDPTYAYTKVSSNQDVLHVATLIEAGRDTLNSCVIWFNVEDFNTEEYVFNEWRMTNTDTGIIVNVTNDQYVIGDPNHVSNQQAIVWNMNTQYYASNSYAVVQIGRGQYVEGNWKIEPVVEKKAPVSPYSFSLIPSKGMVDAGDEVSIDICLNGTGVSYNCATAVITYDADLFEYISGSGKLDIDSSSAGRIDLEGIDITDIPENGLIAQLVFTAKNTAQEKDGVFTVTGTAGTKEDCDEYDATPATPASVEVTVSESDENTITYPNGTTVTVANGGSITFTLSEVYPDYEAEGYTYTVTAGDLTVTDNNDGTYTIREVTKNVTVTVEKTLTGSLETVDFKVGETTTYKVAKYVGNAPEGKTFTYDGNPMIFKGDSTYLYIIGTVGEALKAKIDVVSVESIALPYDLSKAIVGDVNQTGKIDINDAQFVSDIYNGEYALGDTEMIKFFAADVNGFDGVDINDARAVVTTDGFVY